MQSTVTGTSEVVTSAMPAGDSILTWAFATGACGSENWAGITPAAIASNVATFVSSGKKYIVSTGGANGSFTCASDAGFSTFIKTYYSANMVGVDFDIEAGQSQSDIDNLVARVKTAQATYPNMKFWFTVGTWAPSQSGSAVAVNMGSSSPNPLGSYGVMVMNSIKSAGLTNYTINLMTMDYGTASNQYCVVSGGACEMGQSAIQAAMDLHGYYGIPYSQIAVTPMTGANDTAGEDFTVADTDLLSAWVKTNGLAGVAYWSFDRDTSLTYTNEFIKDLGL
jgi:hypothetical protein